MTICVLLGDVQYETLQSQVIIFVVTAIMRR